MKSFKWSLVSGKDFARSIKWARTQPRLIDIIKAKIAEKKKSA